MILAPEPIGSIDEWLATEIGGVGIARAQAVGPAATRQEILRSGLRGRGGAGFLTGRKWEGVTAAGPGTRSVVCNAAEGEPATFKDRALIRANPYQTVEGLVIAAFAVGAEQAYICLKASFEQEIEAITRAVQELQAAGICAECPVSIVAGPPDYLYGEEKAMLEVIEGKPALPRLLPPYEHGLFAGGAQLGWEATSGAQEVAGLPNPTLVNNAETLSNVPAILAHGASWFRTMGTDESPGTVVSTVTGDVVAPGVGEVEMGTPLRAVIDGVGGGCRPGRTVKAVLSGVANPMLPGVALDTPVSYEGFAAAGSGLGAAGFWVLDDDACLVQATLLVSAFLAVESCGQCPPCKLGSGEITARLEALEHGAAGEQDVDHIQRWLRQITDGSRCYLATQEQRVVASLFAQFPEEVVAHLEGTCPNPRPLTLPKLVDQRDGVVVAS